jgi:5-methylcytosine-specific restriction endonuclease McrA
VGRELPEPNTPELAELIADEEPRLIYGFLYERRDDPPTMLQVREHVEAIYGEPHSQTDRRLRDLRDKYLLDIRTERRPGTRDPVYRLTGFREGASSREGRAGINARKRAEVLTRFRSRCAMCGKTPVEDAIKLTIDHIVPLDWGGSNDPENLQPLCQECNAGKKAHYSSFDEYAEAIRQAIHRPVVHERIGELLKALEGVPVPVELITLVAREENRGDPTRRMRALRDLGWTIEVSYSKEGKRKRSFYTLTHWEPWPAEGVRARLKALGKSS